MSRNPKNRGGFYEGIKLRPSNLPSAVDEDGVRPLPLKPDQDLGEAMCFAYFPQATNGNGVAVIQYAHTGPRHRCIVGMLGRLGWGTMISLEPIFRGDAWQRFDDANLIRKMTFRLRDPKDSEKVRGVGRSVKGAIDVLEDTDGIEVEVTVSVGRKRRHSLVVERVKRICSSLADCGDMVDKLTIAGDTGEINLLRDDHLSVDLTVDETSDRELDKDDCKRKLIQAYWNNASDVFTQVHK